METHAGTDSSFLKPRVDKVVSAYSTNVDLIANDDKPLTMP